MSAAVNSETDRAHVLAQVWLDSALCGALEQAARDARDTRAGYLRRIIAESVRLTGYLDPVPNPRRHRARRRQEAVA